MTQNIIQTQAWSQLRFRISLWGPGRLTNLCFIICKMGIKHLLPQSVHRWACGLGSLLYIRYYAGHWAHSIDQVSRLPRPQGQVFLGGRPPAVNCPTQEKILTVKEAHGVSTGVRGKERVSCWLSASALTLKCRGWRRRRALECCSCVAFPWASHLTFQSLCSLLWTTIKWYQMSSGQRV